MREIDTAAFEDIAFFDHARDAAAAFGPLPRIARERLAVDVFKGRDDARLKVEQPGFDAFWSGG